MDAGDGVTGPIVCDSNHSGAVFSADSRHRYQLYRRLADEGATQRTSALFIMLNPSTATHTEDDPTIRRCVRFARDWGHGHLYVANLFSLRSTDPRALRADETAEGDPENRHYITVLAMRAARTVCAWGAHGSLRGRGTTIVDMLAAANVELWSLGLTQGGQPRHPLYLSAATKPTRWCQGRESVRL